MGRPKGLPRKEWKCNDKKRLAFQLICGAYIELKEWTRNRKENGSYNLLQERNGEGYGAETLLTREQIKRADEEGVWQRMKKIYDCHVNLVTVVPVEAFGYTIDDVHHDLHCATGGTGSKKHTPYTGEKLWKQGKRIYKVLRNHIQVAYAQVKDKGLLKLSGPEGRDHNLRLILLQYWTMHGSRTQADLTRGEAEEEEQVEAETEESAAAPAAAAEAEESAAAEAAEDGSGMPSGAPDNAENEAESEAAAPIGESSLAPKITPDSGTLPSASVGESSLGPKITPDSGTLPSASIGESSLGPKITPDSGTLPSASIDESSLGPKITVWKITPDSGTLPSASIGESSLAPKITPDSGTLPSASIGESSLAPKITPDDGSLPSAFLAVVQPMPPNYQGPLEWEAWLKFGPLGATPDSYFNVELNDGPLEYFVPSSLRNADEIKRIKHERRVAQRAAEQERNDNKRMKVFDENYFASSGTGIEAAAQQIESPGENTPANKVANGTEAAAQQQSLGENPPALGNPTVGDNGIKAAALLQSQIDGRSQYRSQQIEQLEKRIALMDRLKKDTTAVERELLELLESKDEQVEKYYAEHSNFILAFTYAAFKSSTGL